MNNILYEMAAVAENEVFSMQPVFEISSIQIVELEGERYKTFVMNAISSIPIDPKYTVNFQTIGEIYSHHCVGRNLKKAALLALPYILNANHVISPWRKGRNKKQLSGEVGAPILIDGAKYLCNVTLLRNANNKITPYAITLKDASLSIITEKKAIDNISVHNSNSKNSAFGDIRLSKIATSQDANTPLKLGAKINEINDKYKYYNQNLNKTMKKNKNVMRLTEAQLHKVIKESVRQVLSELNWKTYANAAKKQLNIDKEEPAYYANDGKYESERTTRFKDAARKAFARQHEMPYCLAKDFRHEEGEENYNNLMSMGDFLDSNEGSDNFYINGGNKYGSGGSYAGTPLDDKLNFAKLLPQHAKDDIRNYNYDNYEYEPNGGGWHLRDGVDESIRRAIKKVLQ